MENEKFYLLAIDRPESQIETVGRSIGGIRFSQIVSFISFTASVLIIYISYRSKGSLRRQCNRFICGFGTGELLSSFAAFLTTWPMPVDTIYFQSEGAKYGNFSTCAAQGGVFMLGRLLSVCFIMALCIYYAHIVGGAYCFPLRTRTDTLWQSPRLDGMGKIRDRLLLCFCLVTPAIYSIEAVRLGMINPTLFRPVCSLQMYPYCYEKNNDEYEECSKEERDIFGRVKLYGILICMLVTSISVLCMISICSSTLSRKREMRRGMNRLLNGRDLLRQTSNHVEIVEKIKRQMRDLSIVIMLAAGYLFQLIVVQLLVAVSYVFNAHTSEYMQYFIIGSTYSRAVFLLMLVLVDKACNYRRENSDLSFWKALCEVFRNPHDEPLYYFSNLALIEDDEDSDLDLTLTIHGEQLMMREDPDELPHSRTQEMKTFTLYDGGNSSELRFPVNSSSRSDLSLPVLSSCGDITSTREEQKKTSS